MLGESITLAPYPVAAAFLRSAGSPATEVAAPAMRSTLLALAALVAGASFASGAGTGAAAAAAPHPPDGTYVYEIHRDGKTIATAHVVFSAAALGVTVHEHTISATIDALTKTTFDLSTFAEVSYDADITDPEGSEHIAASMSNGTATVDAGSKHFTLKSSASAPALVLVDNLVASNIVIPAIAKASRATAVSLVLLETGQLATARLGTSSAQPPLTALATDAGMTLSFGSLDGTIWYDPLTMVVDEVDFPAQHEVIALVKRIG